MASRPMTFNPEIGGGVGGIGVPRRPGPPWKAIGIGAGAFVLVVLFMMTNYQVEKYEQVVLTRWGAIQSIESEGLHFKMPFVHSITRYRTDIQDITPKAPANTYTIDNQEVDVSFNLFYRIPAKNVEYVYTNVQDYKPRLEALVIDRLKGEMGRVNVAHVAEKRAALRQTILNVLQQDAASLGAEVTDFQLTNIEYTKSFKGAMEAAATAKAGIETREQELQQARKVAESVEVKAKGEAAGARERARGDADGQLLLAIATAKSIELKGQAEATAIKAQTEALTASTQLVELRKAERWNGALPTSMLSNVMPFLNVDQALAFKK